MRGEKLDPPIDLDRDHVLGPPDAELTLVEYGSYSCPRCHAVHDVVAGLRNRFGDRMRYVFRHLPVDGSEDSMRAAELAEYAAETTGKFWEAHVALMERGPEFAEGDFERIARELDLPPRAANEDAVARATARVREDVASADRDAPRHRTADVDLVHRQPDPANEPVAMKDRLGHRDVVLVERAEPRIVRQEDVAVAEALIARPRKG